MHNPSLPPVWRILLLCGGLFTSVICQAENLPLLEMSAPKGTPREADLNIVPAEGTWILDVLVEPRHFDAGGAAGFRFTDDAGSGFRVDFRPRNGGVLLTKLTDGVEDQDVKLDRNPTMNLAESGYTYRLPFRLRLWVGQSRVQLYLGFHGLPADLIHAELWNLLSPVTRVTAFCDGGDVTWRDLEVRSGTMPPPDLSIRPEIREVMPTYAEFVGTHYISREAMKLYRGLHYDPIVFRVLNDGQSAPVDYRPWVAYVNRSELPIDCVARIGPYSGEKIWLRQDRIREIVDWAKTHDAFMLHGRDVKKRTEYLPPLETMLRKDELYWSVRGFLEICDVAELPVMFHLGNEVNAFHVPWKNHPHVVERVVEYNLAPSMEAMRQASADVYGDASLVPIMIGSVTSPWPLGHGFLHAMIEYRIKGDMAPTLAGGRVSDFGDYASIHYVMKGPFWSHYLDAIYQRMVVPGAVKGFWATEEVGGNASLHRGPYMVALPFRSLDWWSRREWQPRRGAVIYWGDTRSRDGYTTSLDVQTMLADFLGSQPLVNLTDEIRVQGSPDIEAYAFAARGAEDVALVIGVMSKDYWFFPDNPAEGRMHVDMLSISHPEWAGRDDLQSVWFRVTDDRIDRVEGGGIMPGPAGSIRLQHPVNLDRGKEEILLGFITNRTEEAAAIFQFSTPAKEPSIWRDGMEVVSFHMGNDVAADMGDESAWTMLSSGGHLGQSSASTRVNFDAGMAGDNHGLTVDRRIEQKIAYTVILSEGAVSHGEATSLEFSLKGDPVSVWWNGELLAEGVSARQPTVILPPSKRAWFGAGEHQIELRNGERQTTTVDALAIRRSSP